MIINHPKVYFCYANPAGFSGQKDATKVILAGLSKRGWACCALPQPVRNRGAGKPKSEFVRYAGSLLLAWTRALRLLLARRSWLHVNMGQTWAAFLRDGIPLLFAALGVGRRRIVISLHGNLFMQWPADSFQIRVFRFLLMRSGLITVSGERQRVRLLAIGLPEDKVMVMVNTCDLEPIGEQAMNEKHHTMQAQIVRVLYLSSLIDTKGFPEYLEALLLLASRSGSIIEAVLCGNVVASKFNSRFSKEGEAETWIKEQLEKLNASERISISWIKGVVGDAKLMLQRATDIFVLPTYYPVESQPLVLLEAMASGSAIITTRAGEIETILDERSALLLPGVSALILADNIQRLMDHRDQRAMLAKGAWTRFLDHYQPEKHLDRWEKIFSDKTVN